MYFPEVFVSYDDTLGQIADKIESRAGLTFLF